METECIAWLWSGKHDLCIASQMFISLSLQELREFARRVVRKFFETLQSNDKVVMELFFWKSGKDAVEITEGYGSYQ